MAASVENNHGLPVYMIYSSWSLSRIEDYLSKYGTVGLLRVVLDAKGNETRDLTLALLNDSMYQALVKAGHGVGGPHRGFSMKPYRLLGRDFPLDQKNTGLFVPVPSELKLSEDAVLQTITDKLEHLVEWEIIPEGSWSLSVPLVSRKLGKIRSGCFISFLPEFKLPMETIAIVRVLLTDTYWSTEDDASYFRCAWAFNKKFKNDRKDKSKPRDDRRSNQQDQKEKRPRQRRRNRDSKKSDVKEKPSVKPAVPIVMDDVPAASILVPEVDVPELNME